MEQTNASEEIIIQEIAMEVESEFQLGGLSDGLYFTFAAEVAKRYALLAVSKERERIVEEIRNFEFDSGFETVFNEKYRLGKEKAREELINLINTK